MLVVLNTMLNNSCLDISMAISAKFNNFAKYSIAGYKVDFTKWPTEAYNSKNELVYRAHTDNIEGVDELSKTDAGKFAIESIKNFENTHILNANKVNHLHDDFYNMLEDYGVELEDYEGDINNIINSYKTKKTKVQVITGVFSKSFIEKIQKYVGKSNVSVYNIIRNPSTAFLFDTGVVVEENSLAEYGMSELKASTYLYGSALSAYTLSTLNYVTTIRYEDIISSGKICINGIDVDLVNITKHNDNISEYEYSNLIDLAISRKEQINIFNNMFQNMHQHNNLVQLPNNLFESLSYEPLSYDEIVS